MSFYVYAITFDQDTFGVFATREEAEESKAEQIKQGGPAWDDCKIERWIVEGDPELVPADEADSYYRIVRERDALALQLAHMWGWPGAEDVLARLRGDRTAALTTFTDEAYAAFLEETAE